ncbi:MAG: alanine racemase [Candidatus Yanofskybacteria bacterium]|nr:alanine racemase [Candidatus Yanofskybacteria bacterium]
MSIPVHNHKTWVEISKDALENNVRIMRGFLKPSTKLLAVVKANAYGHGLKETVSVLKKEADIMFGVDSLQEALSVNSIEPKNEIMILGYVPEKDRILAIKNGFHISVYDKEVLASVARLIKTGQINPDAIKAHLKVETGTNRLGIDTGELKNIKFEFPIAGIYTHFADSENLDSLFYKEQIGILNEAVGILKNKGIRPRFIHSACTAAIMRSEVLGGNLARVGIGLYGLWPSKKLREKLSQKVKLKPVLSWKTKIVQVKQVSKGETVGYDRAYQTKKETSIAVLPVGYYDGFDRKLSQCGEVLINGKRAKVAGRVCMNMTIVDLGDIKAKTGDDVIFIGKSGKEQITVEELAEKISTINYEVVSRINPLLPRIYI